jgi:ribosomal protein S18 acetylase RimI-like enzyme
VPAAQSQLDRKPTKYCTCRLTKARGPGLGRALIDGIVKEAVRIEYSEMRPDTLPSMREALSLYKKVGFKPIEPYYETPIAGTVFLVKALVA